MTMEETFEQLDRILSVLENKDTSLEDAFSAYEKGIKLVKECSRSLDQVEKKIMVLQDVPDEEEG